jgi:hypothetical protein
MVKHRPQNLRFSQATAFLNLLRIIVGVATALVKLWQSLR